jgi:hypothetical protein
MFEPLITHDESLLFFLIGKLFVIENDGSFEGSCILKNHSLPLGAVGYISFIPNLSTPLKTTCGFSMGLEIL